MSSTAKLVARLIRLEISDSLQQPRRELAPDDGGRLDGPLRLFGEAVEPRHDHSLNRVGHVDLVHRACELVPSVRRAQSAGLEERPRHLLDVERVPFRLGEDELLEVRGHAGAEQSGRHGRCILLGEAFEVDVREVGAQSEGLVPARPMREHEHDGLAGHVIDEIRQELRRGVVDPVEVLDEQDLWADGGCLEREIPQGFERPRFSQLRVHERDRLVAGVDG